MQKLSNFKKIFDKQDKVISKYFVLWYSKNDINCNRLGITVSKKFAKKAVSRNRLKRIIRESFRVNFCDFKSSFDVVLMPKSYAYNQVNKKLFLDLYVLWEKLKAI